MASVEVVFKFTEVVEMAAVTIILGLAFTVAELRDSNTPGRTPDGVLPGPEFARSSPAKHGYSFATKAQC